VIEDGKSGFLHAPGALDEMADSAVALLSDPALHRATADAARRRVTDVFCADRVVPMYEACYERLLHGAAGGAVSTAADTRGDAGATRRG